MSDATELNALHIASFQGNVGDNANHNGTRHKLKVNTEYNFSYAEEEIRKYYQNYNEPDALQFDDDFVKRANNHDLVIIGSGNFFELWIEESDTGTTIDMKTERVDEIEVPIIFYGLGCDPYKGIPGDNQKKFQKYLDHILQADHCLVSVRNDGSLSHIKRIFGSEYADKVYKVPDGGFFTKVDDNFHPELTVDKKALAVNVAKDMIDMRFPNSKLNSHTYKSFIKEFGKFLDEFLNSYPDYEIVFIPHIYSDLDAISDLLEQMDNMHRRGRVTTAPYLTGEGSERYIFDTYRKANLAMGMRFHTNVCSIGQHTPSIGLVSYPKVGDLYDIELSMPNRTIDLKQKGFSDPLYELTEDSLENQEKIRNKYAELCNSLNSSVSDFHREINSILENYIIK